MCLTLTVTSGAVSAPRYTEWMFAYSWILVRNGKTVCALCVFAQEIGFST